MKFNRNDIKNLQLKKQFSIVELDSQDKNIEKSMANIITSLGFVQLDSMTVTSARSQDLIFYNRDKNYQINDYLRLYEKDFANELYLHALSLVPSVSELNHLLHGLRYKKLEALNEKDRYLELFRKEGNNLSQKKESWQLSDKDIVTNALWRAGLLRITRNEKFNKLYDLKPDVVTYNLSQEEISEKIVDQFVLLSLQNMGLATFSDIKRYFNLKTKELGNSITKLLTQHLIKLAGQYDGEDYYILSQDEALMDTPAEIPCKFLSPFDNAIKERMRLNRLFDIDYKLESYVPQNKRKFGYFAMPILIDHHIIGTIDLKTDTKTKLLTVKQLTLKSAYQQKYLLDIEKTLLEFKTFTNMDKIAREHNVTILE